MNLQIKSLFRDLCMSIIVIWLTNPYQTFFENWYIYGILWILWCIFAYISDSKSFKCMILNKNSIIVFMIPVLTFILSLMDWAKFSIYQFTIPFIIISAIYYLHGNHFSSLKLFAIIYLTYMLLINIYSIQRIIEVPRIARILASSDENITQKYASPFTANFEHIVSISLVSLCLLYAITKKDIKTKEKVTYLILLCISIIVIIMSQYVIALIIFLVFSSILLFINIGNRKYRALKIILYILCCVLIFLNIANILNFIIEIFPDKITIVKQRLEELRDLFINGQISQNSDMAERRRVYSLSFNTFIQHPFFGVGGKVFRAYGKVGGHSWILDNFAYYGLFIGIFYIIMIFSAANSLKSELKKMSKNFAGELFSLIFFSYFINCCLNLCYREEILIVIYFIIPAFIYTIERKNDNT